MPALAGVQPTEVAQAAGQVGTQTSASESLYGGLKVRPGLLRSLRGAISASAPNAGLRCGPRPAQQDLMSSQGARHPLEMPTLGNRLLALRLLLETEHDTTPLRWMDLPQGLFAGHQRVSALQPGRAALVPASLAEWLQAQHETLPVPSIAVAEMAQGIGKLRRAGGTERAGSPGKVAWQSVA